MRECDDSPQDSRRELARIDRRANGTLVRRPMRELGPLDFVPLWAFFPVTLAAVLLAIEGGFGSAGAAPR